MTTAAFCMQDLVSQDVWADEQADPRPEAAWGVGVGVSDRDVLSPKPQRKGHVLEGGA